MNTHAEHQNPEPAQALEPDGVTDPPAPRHARRLARLHSDRGATTAEYAITTLAACGFAALLVVILKSEPLRDAITGIITNALKLGG